MGDGQLNRITLLSFPLMNALRQRYFPALLLLVVVCVLKPLTASAQGFTKDRNYVSVDTSFSAFKFQYNRQPPGNRLGLGFRLGLSKVKVLVLDKNYELAFKVNYSQLGSRYIRVVPTGILDTNNVYNSLQIYQEEARLQYANTGAEIRKKIWTTNSVDIFVGLNVFVGGLLSTRHKGYEVQGLSSYNSQAISLSTISSTMVLSLS